MTAPGKIVLQPCPTYGWDHPDRVKYPVEPAVEYIRADLIPATPLAAALAVPEVKALLGDVMEYLGGQAPVVSSGGHYNHDLRLRIAAMRGVEGQP